ncbi:MAG: AbrB/MazE/SpoVT family DNA-binding domain-containing protein [Bacteroidota bacterium]
MQTTIQKWGNSQGLRIPKTLLEEVDIGVGESVEIDVLEGKIIISPTRKKRGAVSLQDLVSKIPKGKRSKEKDWGPPVGKEVW